VATIIGSEAFDSLGTPIIRLASPDIPAFPYNPMLEKACPPSVEKITGALHQFHAY